MTKEEMEIELRKCLSILINGAPDEFRNAKKGVERLLHQRREEFRGAAPVALEYLPLFDSIKKAQNQAALASGLSLFFLILGDEYFDILKDFTLKALQHPNGSVRHAMLNTAEWLYVSLTSRINSFIYPKGKKFTERQKIEENQAKIQYIGLVNELEFLIDISYQKNESVLYIEEMKPSINKSLQFFWSRLTESRTYKNIEKQIRPIPIEVDYAHPVEKFQGFQRMPQRIHRS